MDRKLTKSGKQNRPPGTAQKIPGLVAGISGLPDEPFIGEKEKFGESAEAAASRTSMLFRRYFEKAQ
ncbi:MAG: hypothetical protein PHQ47_02795 [Candidatus Portnoybacteria bacterium]|nr:hypothetical protein [Candidatus Portnoybacteria bacterium]